MLRGGTIFEITRLALFFPALRQIHTQVVVDCEWAASHRNLYAHAHGLTSWDHGLLATLTERYSSKFFVRGRFIQVKILVQRWSSSRGSRVCI